jgi:hypothetical protein
MAQEVADGCRSLVAAVARALLCEPLPVRDEHGLPSHALSVLLEATQALAHFERIQEQIDADGAVAGVYSAI